MITHTHTHTVILTLFMLAVHVCEVYAGLLCESRPVCMYLVQLRLVIGFLLFPDSCNLFNILHRVQLPGLAGSSESAVCRAWHAMKMLSNVTSTMTPAAALQCTHTHTGCWHRMWRRVERIRGQCKVCESADCASVLFVDLLLLLVLLNGVRAQCT